MPKKVGTELWQKQRLQAHLERKRYRYYILCEVEKTEPLFTYNYHVGTETISREAVEEAFGLDLTRLAPEKLLNNHATFWTDTLVVERKRTAYLYRVS